MNKLIIGLCVASATMVTVACQKQGTETFVKKGIPAQFVVEDPSSDLDDGTKVCANGKGEYGGSPRWYSRWEDGDICYLTSFSEGAEGYADWGAFTASVGANKKAVFHGLVPEQHSGTTILALHSSSAFEIKWDKSGNRYNAYFNIPSTQDGTGFRYALIGAKATSYSEGVITFPTSGGNQFTMRSALTCITVPAEADIRTIQVTVTKKGGGNWNIFSNGDNKDMAMNTTSFGLFGGGSNTVTITNGGVLSGDVFFASRHTTGGDASTCPVLTFVFTNGNGEQSTKKVELVKNSTVLQIGNAKVNKLGSVSFAPGDFVTP